MAAKKNPKPRNFPSEDRVDTRPRADLGGLSYPQAAGLSMDAALKPSDLTELERILECATPEQFQQEMSKCLRRLLVAGLREIPPPRSIKEVQVIYDMFRKAEGIERADKQGGPVAGGFLPRVVARRALGETIPVVSETVVQYPAEQVETVPAEEVPTGAEEVETVPADDEFEV